MTGAAPTRRAAGLAHKARLRVLVCPDSFKGTITAQDASAALREGWLSARPGDELTLLPMADGGEGTLDALAAAAPGARRHELAVTGPDGRPVRAAWLELPDVTSDAGSATGPGTTSDAPEAPDSRATETPTNPTAAIELAATSGIGLMPRLQALDATTTGLGEAIRAALEAGMEHLLIGIGSSASTDGGAGLLTALGARFLDAGGRPIRPGARGLADLASVDLSGLVPTPAGGVIVLSDVRSPLTGPTGAAAVFGRQKGLTPTQIPGVDQSLAHLARLLGIDPTIPGAGAAGGTGAALLAWGGHLRPGAPEIARTIGLPNAIRAADLVITGEGRYDAQTASGKVISHIEQLAAEAGTRLAIVAGALAASPPPGASALSLTDIAGSAEEAMSAPGPALREAGRLLATHAAVGHPGPHAPEPHPRPGEHP